MFSLPHEIQSLIYLFDQTYHEHFREVRKEIESGWGVCTVSFMGSVYPSSVIRWGLTRIQAEACTEDLRKTLGLAESAPPWAIEFTYMNENNVPLLLAKRTTFSSSRVPHRMDI